MVTAGVDCGAKNTKVVLCEEGKILSQSSVLTGFDQKAAAEEAFNEALKKAGLSEDDIASVIATGDGKDEVTFAKGAVTVVKADAVGTTHLLPSVRTVIDVGAEESRAIRCDQKGKVVDFAVNEKCAAGAGTFVETMARALEVELEDMGRLSLKSQKEIPMNAQCTVFAESEVVSLIHAGTSKEDIIRAVHDSMADRIVAMARRASINEDIALIGGGANNIGLSDSLERELGLKVLVPENPEPQFVTALGAALVGADQHR